MDNLSEFDANKFATPGSERLKFHGINAIVAENRSALTISPNVA
jgi:hypothetical protein